VKHRVISFWGSASLLAAAFALFGSSGCGGTPECSGATRGCVQLQNTRLVDITVNVRGDGSVVVPAGTSSAPGMAWITVDSTVGAEVTFFVGALNPGIDTCVVTSNAWTDPSAPPQVAVYSLSGHTAVRCGANW
jgi:hypothetical protein